MPASISPVLSAEGAARSLLAVGSGRIDPLTSLPDRAALVERLHRALISATQERSPVALLLIDLNRFKDVNHTLGHTAGDRILREVSVRIQQTLRACDTLARLGGDEFAVLLPSMDSVGAARAARRIMATLDMPCMLEDHSIDIGASIGIAIFPEQGKDGTALLRQADVAMYVAKNTGGGYAIYNAEQDQNSPLPFSAGQRTTPRACRGATIRLHYQPLVDITTGQVARRRGAGALAASRARADPARPVHPPGRADRPDRAADALGAGRGAAQMPRWQKRGRDLAWRSTSPCAPCTTPNCRRPSPGCCGATGARRAC